MESQEKVWNKIAKEWHKFKTERPARHAIEFLEQQKGRVLDLGSGSGRHLIPIKQGQIYLVDFSKNMIDLAKKYAKKQKIKAEFKVAKLNNLPFENNFFDAAICMSALHCVETEKKRENTIKELYRVLKPKAKALIGVWDKDSKRFKNSQKERTVRWRNKGARYYYLYNEKEIHDLFKKNKFKIIKTLNSPLMINFIVQKNQFSSSILR